MRSAGIILGIVLALGGLQPFAAVAGPKSYDVGVLLYEPHPFANAANVRAVPQYRPTRRRMLGQPVQPLPAHQALVQQNSAYPVNRRYASPSDPVVKPVAQGGQSPARTSSWWDRLEKKPALGNDQDKAKRYRDGIYIIKKDYLYSYAENSWRILRSPFDFDTSDWVKAGIITGITGALLFADKDIRDFWQDDVRGGTSDDLEQVFDDISDRRNLALGLIGAYTVSEIFDWRREKAATLMAVQAVLLSTAVTEGLKFAAGRERPSDTNDEFAFGGPTTERNKSFPSSHASGSFALASVVSDVYYDDHPWVPWIAYPLATGVSLARINENRHWASDIFFGGAVGYFIGKLVVRYNPFLEENNVVIRPLQNSKVTGVSIHVPL